MKIDHFHGKYFIQGGVGGQKAAKAPPLMKINKKKRLKGQKRIQIFKFIPKWEPACLKAQMEKKLKRIRKRIA